MGATDDDGMGDVTTDEVDEDMLSMTQRMGLSHVVGDEVTGDGYPVGIIMTIVAIIIAAITVIRLPVISDMSAVVTVMSNSTAVCVYDAGTHETCETRMWLSKLA